MAWSVSHFTRYIALKDYLARSGGLLPVHGIQISLPMKYAVQFYRQIFNNSYEAREVELVRRFLPTDRGVVELGCSLGIVASVIRNHLNDDVAMTSVEANPNLVDIARANIARHDPKGRAKLLFAALSYGGREVSFSIGRNAHVNALAGSNGDAGNVETVRVPAITLAEIVEQMGGGKGMSLVCDIEGAEWELAENDRTALKHFDVIVVETHPDVFRRAGRDPEDFHAMVRDAGFRAVAQEGDVFVYLRDAKRKAGR
ncbi:MAG: FkbM family methyltransferase [Rhizobiaceae bacterium]